jgi:mobilization protein NikA
MKKRGRPKIAASDRRKVVLRLRLTTQEYKTLCDAAKLARVSVSEYARKLIGR